MIDFRRMRELIKAEERLRWALLKERSKATKATTSLSKNGGGGRGRTSSRVGDGAIALAIIQEEYDHVADELKRQRKELRGKLKRLTERERTIIRMRYIGGISCRQIAEDMHYDKFYMHSLSRIAENRILEMQDADNNTNSSQ